MDLKDEKCLHCKIKEVKKLKANLCKSCDKIFEVSIPVSKIVLPQKLFNRFSKGCDLSKENIDTSNFHTGKSIYNFKNHICKEKVLKLIIYSLGL